MTGWDDLRAHALSDMGRGVRQPMEDIAIAKLVVAPFVLTVVVLLGWMVPLSALWAIVLYALLMSLATAWNAGWRARGTVG